MAEQLGPLAIVNYHYCHPADHRFPGLKGITPEHLDCQIRTLKEHFLLASLSEVVDCAWQRPGPVAVLTFDDGIKDVVEFVLPVLERHGVTTTFFVSSAPYLERELLHVHRIHLLQATLGISEFQERFRHALDSSGVEFEYGDPDLLGICELYPHDTPEVRAFKTDLNYRIPYPVVAGVLRDLVKETLYDEEEITEAFYLSREDIKTCINSGHELGLHSHHHWVLSRLSVREQLQEVRLCMKFCEDTFGLKKFSFSYPYGITGAYNEDSVSVVAKEDKIYAGLTLSRRLATRRDLTQAWEIPRLDNRDVFEEGGGLRSDFTEALAANG